jgi:hypothetical protein
MPNFDRRLRALASLVAPEGCTPNTALYLFRGDWLADIALPGGASYVGEGATPSDALDRLAVSLGYARGLCRELEADDPAPAPEGPSGEAVPPALRLAAKLRALRAGALAPAWAPTPGTPRTFLDEVAGSVRFVGGPPRRMTTADFVPGAVLPECPLCELGDVPRPARGITGTGRLPREDRGPNLQRIPSGAAGDALRGVFRRETSPYTGKTLPILDTTPQDLASLYPPRMTFDPPLLPLRRLGSREEFRGGATLPLADYSLLEARALAAYCEPQDQTRRNALLGLVQLRGSVIDVEPAPQPASVWAWAALTDLAVNGLHCGPYPGRVDPRTWEAPTVAAWTRYLNTRTISARGLPIAADLLDWRATVARFALRRGPLSRRLAQFPQ